MTTLKAEPKLTPAAIARKKKALLRKFTLLQKMNTGAASNINIKGTQAATSGKTTVLPLGNFEDPEYLDMLEGMIDHENGHCKHTNFNHWHSISNKLVRQLTNIFEDVRIEKLVGNEYPGARANLVKLVNICIKRGLFSVPKESDVLIKTLQKYLLYTGRFKHLEQITLADFSTLAGIQLKKKVPQLFDQLESIVIRCGRLHSTKDAIELAEEVLKLLKSEIDNKKDEKKQNDQKKSNSKDNSDSSKDDSDADSNDDADTDSNDNSDSSKDDSDADSNDDADTDSNDNSDSSKDDSDADYNDDADTDSNDNSDSSSEPGNEKDDSEADSEDDADTNSNDHADADSNDDATDSNENSDSSSNDKSDTDSHSDEALPESVDSEDLEKAIQELDDAVNATDQDLMNDMHDDIRNLMEEKAEEHLEEYHEKFDNTFIEPSLPFHSIKSDKACGLPDWVPEAKKLSQGVKMTLHSIVYGRNRVKRHLDNQGSDLSAGSLWGVRAGNSRIFQTENISKAPNSAFSILVDKSGSMGITEMRKANIAAYAIAQAIEFIKGSECEVLYYPFFNEERVACNHIAKAFNEKMSAVTTKSFNVLCEGGTPTPEALQGAMARLSVRKETKKTIFLITDGRASEAPMRNALTECDFLGINVICIGIGTGRIGGFEDRPFVRINESAELAKALFGFLKDFYRG